MGRPQRWSVAFALVALMLLGAACGATPEASPGDDPDPASPDEGGDEPTDPGDTGAADDGEGTHIVSASGTDPRTLDPQKVSDTGRDMLLWRVYESLIAFDHEANPQPLLAAELPVLVDETTWEVELRTGIEFSNGAPFDADSAVYSINRMVDPGYATEYPEVGTIAGAEKVDDDTIRVTTTNPDPLFVNRLKTIAMLPLEHGDLEEEAIGTGPYMLESFTPGGGGEIVYNPNYRGDRPEVTRVTYRVIPDANTRMQALTAGEVDLVPAILPDLADSAPKVAMGAQPTQAAYMRLNAVDGPFADLRLRQAVNFGVDREGMVQSLFGEFAAPAACQIGPPHTGGANASLEPWPYDPERARELVEEAGATGTTIDIAGVTGYYAMDRDAAQVVAQQLEDIGLSVNLTLEEYTVWFDSIYATQADAPDMTFAETTDNLGHIDRFVGLFYHSEGPVSAYSDPEMDELISSARSELEEPAKQDAWDAVLQKGCDDALALFLYDRHELLGMSEHLEYQPGVEQAQRINYDEIDVLE